MHPVIESLSLEPNAAERAALKELLRGCIEGGASIGFVLPVSDEELETYWTKVLADHLTGARLILVAHDAEGRILGSVQLALEARRNGRHRAEVQKLMVRPDARKTGTGRRLMQAIEAEATSAGVSLLFLDTSEGEAGATAFYSKLGYQYCGGIPGYALDPDGTPSRNAIFCRELVRDTARPVAKPALPPASISVVPLEEAHWPAASRIYAEGIATGHSTFQDAPPASWAEFNGGKVPGCNLAAVDSQGTLLGWAVLSPTSTRPVYRGVCEVSIYVGEKARGLGVGAALLSELIRKAEAQGIWSLQSGTFPENTASVAMQLRQGFRVVGRRERMAKITHGPWAGRWRDVLLLERRSRDL